MFHNDDSHTSKRSETRSKRVTRSQSSLLACLHAGEGTDQSSAQRERTAEGDRQQGNIMYECWGRESERQEGKN